RIALLARRVLRIATADHRQHARRVVDAAAQHADLVERGAERDEPPARDAPVGGLDPHHAAQRSRLAHRAAGLGAEGRGHGTRRHQGRRAARGAPGDAGRVEGDEGLAELARGRQAGVEASCLDEAVGRRAGAGERFAGIAHESAPSNAPSFGTRKKPSLKAGANASGPKARGMGFTSSARKRSASGPGTNGFTPSLAGTALIWATYSRIRDICSARSGSASSLTSSSARRAIFNTSSCVTLMRSPTRARARRRRRAIA